MSTAQAIRYHEHGKPLEVLRLEEIEAAAPGPGQVQVRLLAACINPSDFGTIGGSYGRLQQLPAIAGREGVGEIVETGEGVDSSLVGRRIRMPDDGAWRSHATVPVEGLWLLPDYVPLDMAAMAYVNPPTAWRLLRDAHLPRGEWVIQNAANSAVGIFVMQMAKHLGLQTINVVRREEVVQPLKDLGAEHVVLDTDEYPKEVAKITGGRKPQLALNMVGGESAIRLIKSLADGGRVVTFGGAAFEPVRFPTRFLIFNDIVLSGFWMDRWYRSNSRERIDIMLSKIYALMRDGTISAPIEGRYPLERFRDAVEHASRPRVGKILLQTDA